jgi:hypothetical protein
MTLDQVIDMAHVIIVEGYQSAGMGFFEAVQAVDDIGKPKTETHVPKPQEEAASMAVLQAAMQKTSFKGPKG